MGQKSNRKGMRGVRELAELLRDVFPEVRHRVSGEERQDERPGRDLVGTPGYCFQSNLAACPPIPAKLREAISASERGEIAVALTRRCSATARAEPWLATLTLDDFLTLVVRARKGRDERPGPGGARAAAGDACVCGDRRDEHGAGDGACDVITCGCVAYVRA